MAESILQPVFGTVLTAAILLFLSKKHSPRWVLLAYAVYYAALFAFFGNISGSSSFAANALSCLVYAATGFVPFVLFAIFAEFDSFFQTLIFPTGVVIMELLAIILRISPFMGTVYRFFHVTPLIQSVSIIGAAGLSFIISWFISSTVTLFVRKFERKYVAAEVLSVFLIAVITMFGIVRLNNDAGSTRIVHGAWTTGPELSLADDEWQGVSFEENLNSFLKTSAEASDNGAEILIYTEEAFEIEKEKAGEFLQAASDRAKETGMGILIGFDLVGEDDEKSENCLYYISSKGVVSPQYNKYMLIPFLEDDYVRGDGVIGTASDVFGCGGTDLAYSICFDGNFELYSRQMPDDTDIYLYTAWDWEAIEDEHTMIAGFRAVENGVTLVKSTAFGDSVMYDACGRILFETGTADGFEKVYTFDIPLSDTVTFYERYGLAENIAFLALAAALFVFAGVSMRKKS